ncbi:XdhC family protein [Galbitalea soli]|uniref:XdhC family protein n=1 Tax=Galbitalea soli TaxID=1268042 RepID=A0A7C9PNC1_9MICO|nr:XdhC/CoxI family protein [Galbitalea soli]NEM91447.1 XdhC family protein [Galbitalea soli]NYJ30140.1 xanthine dehydrogenase accessory factor [Galbitalea soli]
MFEIADRLLAVLDAGRPLAVATAVAIEGSAPRTVGTSMAFDGEAVLGSIAGGCVEGAVVEACEAVLADGLSRTVDYGVSDETAYSVGLTCGGQLSIVVRLVRPGDEVHGVLRDARLGHPVALLTPVPPAADAPDDTTPLTAARTTELAARHAARLLAERDSRIALGGSALSTIDCDGEPLDVFVEVATEPAHLVIVGAMEFSAALSRAAQALGYRVTVCDARPLFATPARFPGASVVVGWPPEVLPSLAIDARSVVCVLSHDARFDAEVIHLALDSPAGFVGAMGSRRTHGRRLQSLRERGVGEEALGRLHSPIGLDLGASTPEETAISILAEVLQARTASSARPLRSTQGQIHTIREAVRA